MLSVFDRRIHDISVVAFTKKRNDHRWVNVTAILGNSSIERRQRAAINLQLVFHRLQLRHPRSSTDSHRSVNVCCEDQWSITSSIFTRSLPLSVQHIVAVVVHHPCRSTISVATNVSHTPTRNESMPIIITNDTIKVWFFLNCNQYFGNFKP